MCSSPSTDLSIIIPVYNCKDYLRNCIESIIAQEGVTTDIILVNDGSTDGSEDIIRMYSERYDNISFISQKNSGSAAARNRGIEVARGRYTLFVDADDCIVGNSLAQIVKVANDNNVDILQLTHYIAHSDGDRKEKRIHPVGRCMDGIAYFRLMQKKRCLITAPFNNLLKTDFLRAQSFRFDEKLVRCQDLEFFTKIMLKSERIMNHPLPYYLYNVNTPTGGGRSRSNTALLFDCYRTIAENFTKFAKSEGLGKEMGKRLDYLVCSHIYGYPADVFRSLPAPSRKHWIKFVRKHIFYNNGWFRPHLYVKMLCLNSILREDAN